MSFTLYKPNKSNTGSACQFNLKLDDENKSQAVYAQITKQVSWANNKGVFKGGARLVTKLSITELGAILDVIRRNVDWSTVHSTANGMTQVHFKKYMRPKTDDTPETQLGYSFSLGRKNGEATEWFRIGISFAEVQILQSYLGYTLALVFTHQDRMIKEGKSEAPAPKEEPEATPQEAPPQEGDLSEEL